MYTPEEVQDAVEKLVQSSIRRPVGVRGNRELSVTFSDIQNAAAGVFVTSPTAPYYVVLLGANRLYSAISSVLSSIEELLQAVTATGRRSLPIDNLSSLFNASTALYALETAASNRDTSFSSIEDVPAYIRFKANTDRFLEDTGGNIRLNGEAVQTPEEARVRIPALISSLKSAYEEVVEGMQYLSASIDDFSSLQLASSLTSSIIANARSVIGTAAEEMDALGKEGRLERLKDVTLDVLAARAVVRGFGSLPAVSSFVNIEGDSQPYADNDHLALPASKTADEHGPYPVVPGETQLDVQLESDTSLTTTLSIPGSFVAQISGALSETYNVTAPDDVIRIEVTGVVPVDVTLNVAPASSAYAQVEAINSACVATWGANPYVEAEVYYYPSRWTGEVTIVADGVFPGIDRIAADASVDFAALGVTAGTDVLVVRTGSNKRYTYAIINVIGNVLWAVITNGGPTVTDTDVRIDIGPYPGLVRLFIPEPHYSNALEFNWYIRLPTDDGAGTDYTTALTSIGFYPEMVAYSRPITALEIAEEVNKTPAVAPRNNTRIVLDTEFSADIYTGKGRTSTTSSLTYILYKVRGNADVSTVGAVTTVTLANVADSGVSIGDVLVLREAADSADVNKFGPVTGISDTYVEVTFSAPPTDVSDVLVEIGPSFLPPNNCILRVSEGSLADGEYRVVRSGVLLGTQIPFELPLENTIPVVTYRGLPVFAENAELGYRSVTFTSTDETTDTRLQITDGDGFYYDSLLNPIPNPSTAMGLFFSSPVDERGTTAYVQIPRTSSEISIGDVFELYLTSPLSPSSSHTIVGLELSRNLIEVDPPVSTDMGVVAMGLDIQIPFARIRRSQGQTFDTFKEQAESWLSLSQNNPVYFQNMYAAVNPLVYSTNPSAVAVGTAYDYINQLYAAALLGMQILESYSCSVVPSVDTLVASFIEKGADRAVDVLLQGRFSTFFGMSTSSVSYSGYMLEQIRDVSRIDLPLRKVRRGVIDKQSILAEYEEQDFEFDISDVEDPTPESPI